MMTFKEKRKAKKLSRLGYVLAWAFVVLFILIMVISVKHSHLPWIAFALLALALLAMVLEGTYRSKRESYLQDIKTYRTYRFFILILNYVEAGDYEKAIRYKNSIHDSNIYNFVQGYLSGVLVGKHATQEQNNAIIANLRETFNPEKVWQ
jgi:hypothetical protein